MVTQQRRELSGVALFFLSSESHRLIYRKEKVRIEVVDILSTEL